MNLQDFLRILTMNHESLCRCLCIARLESNPVTIDKMYQKRARLAYVLWIYLMGILLIFTKAFPTEMYYYLYNSLNCVSNTYMNTCFSLVIIYRLAFTIFLYHFIIMCLNGSRSKVSNFINDFCWPLKIIIFAQIFFITCLITNGPFEFIAMIFKWVSMIFVIVKTVFISDGLFYYFNKGRLRRTRGFKKCWNIFAYFVGGTSFLLGNGLFIFCFYWYNYICTDYKVITSAMFVLSWLIVIVNLFVYYYKPEINYCLVFFLFMSLSNYGIIAATPYTTCVNLLNRNFVYSKTSLYVDSVTGNLTRFSYVHIYAFVFGKRKLV